MYFANPWGLLALLALPVIVGLHLFRRRFPPLYVAGAHLWGIETRVADAGRRRDRLPITASLILELLAALLLALALSEPRLDDQAASAHLVIVLDDSASMQATPSGHESFRDAAIREIEQRALDAGRDTRLTILRSGRHPTLIGSRGMRWEEARTVLSEWFPSAARHEFQSAWDEAVQLVGGEGRFLFLTDHPPRQDVATPQGMELLALGESLGNVAITAARWTHGGPDEAGTLYVRLMHQGTVGVTATVQGVSAGQLIFRREVSLDRSSEQPLEVAVPNGLGQIDVTVASAGDSLSLDNHVRLIEPAERTVRVALELAPDSVEFRLTQKALDLLPGVIQSGSDEADLVIGDATTLPASQRERWWLGIGPLNRAEAIREQAVDLLGPYLLERQHPLLDGVTLGGVVWGGVQPTNLRLAPLISVERAILLGRLEGTETTAWIMNIDLSRSNIGESPDWPILLANLVELRRDALPGLRRWNYRLGESIQLRVPPAAGSGSAGLVLRTPDGRRRPLLRDRQDVVDLPPLDDVGLYEILEGSRSLGSFAVNFFDLQESNLLDLGRAHRQPSEAYEPAKISLDNPFSWLIVLAILAILAAALGDWSVVGRRATSAGTVNG